MSNIRVDSNPDRTQVVLEGRVDIRSAIELKQHLTDAVNANLPLVIDCTAADWLDTACLQLLLSAHRAAPGRVTIRTTSDGSVHQWLHSSGFAEHLSLA